MGKSYWNIVKEVKDRLEASDIQGAELALEAMPDSETVLNLHGCIDCSEKMEVLVSLPESIDTLILSGGTFIKTKQALSDLGTMLQGKKVSTLDLGVNAFEQGALTGLAFLPESVEVLYLRKCNISTPESVTDLCKALQGKNVSTLVLDMNDLSDPKTLAAFSALPESVTELRLEMCEITTPEAVTALGNALQGKNVKIISLGANNLSDPRSVAALHAMPNDLTGLSLYGCNIHDPIAIANLSNALEIKQDLSFVDFRSNGQILIDGQLQLVGLDVAMPQLLHLLERNPKIETFRTIKDIDLNALNSELIEGNLHKKAQSLFSILLNDHISRERALRATYSSSQVASSVPAELEEEEAVLPTDHAVPDGKWTRRWKELQKAGKDGQEHCIIS